MAEIPTPETNNGVVTRWSEMCRVVRRSIRTVSGTRSGSRKAYELTVPVTVSLEEMAETFTGNDPISFEEFYHDHAS